MMNINTGVSCDVKNCKYNSVAAGAPAFTDVNDESGPVYARISQTSRGREGCV